MRQGKVDPNRSSKQEQSRRADVQTLQAIAAVERKDHMNYMKAQDIDYIEAEDVDSDSSEMTKDKKVDRSKETVRDPFEEKEKLGRTSKKFIEKALLARARRQRSREIDVDVDEEEDDVQVSHHRTLQ